MNALGYFNKNQYKAIALAGANNLGTGPVMGDVKKRGLQKPGSVTFDNLKRIAKYDALIRICVNAIKKEVSQSEWQIVKKEKIKVWTPELDKQAYQGIELFTDLFENMNANGETFRTLLDRVLEDLLILDAGVIEILRDNKGDITGLNSVDGSTIRPVYNQYGEVGDTAFKQVVDEIVVADFYPDEIIYMMQHPQNGIHEFGYGLSPIESILLAVQASLQADMFNVRAFSEDNVPPGMIDLGDMAAEEAQQFMALWDASVIGNTQKMKFVYGTGGEKKYQPFAKNQKDMQYVEYLDWLSRLKLASYGLSSQDANIMQDVNRATAQVQKSVSNSRGVKTVKQLLEEHLTRALIYSSGYTMIQFKFDKPQNLEEEKIQAEVDEKRINSGIITPEEVREREGLAPLEEVLGEDYADDQVSMDDSKDLQKPTPKKKPKEKEPKEPAKKAKGHWHPSPYEKSSSLREN